MSGTTPTKDQLVHNNLAHKLLRGCRGDLHLTDFGDIASSRQDTFQQTLVKVENEGFSVTEVGAAFILANLPREVLSHREVKIMRDMTRPAPKAKAPPATDAAQEVLGMLALDAAPLIAQLF